MRLVSTLQLNHTMSRSCFQLNKLFPQISRDIISVGRIRCSNTIRTQHRLFTSIANTTPHSSSPTASVQKESQRSRLKNEPINHKLLNQLDFMKLGYIAQRRIRQKVSELYRLEEQQALRAPPSVKVSPFFKRKGKVLLKLDRWEDGKVMQSLAKLPALPQVAIIGRSNVGKSSLVNAILGFDSSFVQKASMSSRPGETKGLAFCLLEQRSVKMQEKSQPTLTNNFVTKPGICFVDMPGYGFAYMNEDDKLRSKKLSLNFLLFSTMHPSFPNSRGLKRVLLLVDARHGIKAADIMFFKELEELYRSYYQNSKVKLSWKLQLVVTKCDLVERKELCKRLSIIDRDISELLPSRFISTLPILPLSSLEQKGVNELKEILATIIA